MFKAVASKIAVFAFDYSTGAPKTGDQGNIQLFVSKDHGALNALGGSPNAALTQVDSVNAPGWYTADVTASEANADVLLFTGKSSTASVTVVGQYVFTRPNRFTTLVIDAAGLVDATAVKIGPTGAGTAQTARDLGTSVLLSSGTGTGQIKLSSGYVAPNWGDVGNPTTTVVLSGTTVKAVTDAVSTSSNIKKNQALSNIDVVMTDSTNHNPTTGLSVTVVRKIDSGAFGAGALSAVTEVANGHYRFDADAADMNGNVITFKLTAIGADDKSFTIFTAP